MFENPNPIPRILRRQEIQESSTSSKPTFRSTSCPIRWIYLEDEPFDEHFETSLFRTSSDSELIDLIPDPLFIEELQLEAINSSINRHLQNSIQSDLTYEGTPNLSVITTASVSSSPFPHTSQPQTTPSTPPSTTQTPTAIPTPTVVSSLLAAMENIYAPLVLPANLGAMPQDYQSKITRFDGTGTYIAQHHTKKMTDHFEIYEISVDDV